MSDPVFEHAQKRVKKKKGFYAHLASFIGVGFFFLAMNLFTLVEEGPEIWFFFPLLPWSIGLIIHYLNVFGFPGNGALSPEWEDKQLQKEMQEIRKKLNRREQKPSNFEEGLELKELQKQREEDWQNDDLV